MEKGRQVYSFDLRNLGDSFYSLRESVLTVYALARSFGIAPKSILTKCSGFVPLTHRIQWVDEIKGITFINDSKATNVDATIHALKTFKNVHLILGGRAKEDNFSQLKDSMKNISRIYLIGEAAAIIASNFEGQKIKKFDTLKDAFDSAISIATHGDTILFSPACASFDQYLNFEERGEHFISLVKEYRKSII